MIQLGHESEPQLNVQVSFNGGKYVSVTIASHWLEGYLDGYAHVEIWIYAPYGPKTQNPDFVTNHFLT